jgi:hypothetical protein
MEGNITGTNILQVIQTQEDAKFLGLLDSNDDDFADKIVLIDTDTAKTSKHIEIYSLVLPGLALTPPIVLNNLKRIKDDEYILVGNSKNPTGSPATFETNGFVVTFKLLSPIFPSSTFTSINSKQYLDHNISDILDVLDINISKTQKGYLLTGVTYNHIGIQKFNTKTPPDTITLNENNDLVWIAQVKQNLDLHRHYINEFTKNVKHRLLHSIIDKNKDFIVMGKIDTNFKLLLFDLNSTPVKIEPTNLKEIAHYAPYNIVTNSINVATSIKPSEDIFLGVYLEEGEKAKIEYSDGLTTPFIIPGIAPDGNKVDFPYTLNATAHITMYFDGYNATRDDEAWEFLDINCSDTAGLNRDINITYIIKFPLSKIDPACQPPNFKFYESDKDLNKINLQWEWIYDKNAPIKWVDIHTTHPGILDSSQIILNTNYLADDHNHSAASLLLNRSQEKFEIMQIETKDGSIISDRKHPADHDINSLVAGRSLITDDQGNLIFVGQGIENNTSAHVETACVVMKIDKRGNELFEQYFGKYWDDGCSSIAILKKNTRPVYTEYLGGGFTNSTNANASVQAWAIKFRDAGLLINIKYGWNLIGNPTDKNITGFKAVNNTYGMNTTASFGIYKYYLLFKDNQWLLNKTPIESLDGFFLVSYNANQQIFLEGDLVEQKFQEIQTGEVGWVLLSTGKKIINPKVVYDLYAIYIYRNNQYQANPIEIYPGEGFWAKKYK